MLCGDGEGKAPHFAVASTICPSVISFTVEYNREENENGLSYRDKIGAVCRLASLSCFRRNCKLK